MASKKKIATRFPPLSRPDPEIAHPLSVRLGDAIISGQFPPRLHRDEKQANRVKPGTRKG
jgi:hypothetical protein